MNKSDRSPQLRAECAARFAKGESVTVLCRYYGVTRAAVYQWIAAANGRSPGCLAKRLTKLEARVAKLEVRSLSAATFAVGAL